jgi:hypothetical protein
VDAIPGVDGDGSNPELKKHVILIAHTRIKINSPSKGLFESPGASTDDSLGLHETRGLDRSTRGTHGGCVTAGVGSGCFRVRLFVFHPLLRELRADDGDGQRQEE